MNAAKLLMPLALLIAPSLAHAQTPTLPNAAPGASPVVVTAAGQKTKGDPNRMVCRTVENTGSRLSKRRECHTASAWAELQALDRRDIEKYQANRGIAGNN